MLRGGSNNGGICLTGLQTPRDWDLTTILQEGDGFAWGIGIGQPGAPRPVPAKAGSYTLQFPRLKSV